MFYSPGIIQSICLWDAPGLIQVFENITRRESREKKNKTL